jgi:hypothetical protein
MIHYFRKATRENRGVKQQANSQGRLAGLEVSIEGSVQARSLPHGVSGINYFFRSATIMLVRMCYYRQEF